jgi:CBS domain-containing protein
MSKAYEVMTQSLAICSPDDNAAHAASIMMERDIGDVLVVDEGKLRGIVTDRDLALQILTNHSDPHMIPVRNIMCEKLVVGSPDWSMGKIARTMAKYQVRRLPIVENDQLMGIISLADIARHDKRRRMLANSLKAISSPPAEIKTNGRVPVGTLVGLGLAALTSTALVLLTWNRSGKELSKQVADTRLYQSTQQAVDVVKDKVDEAASSKAARNFRQRVQANMKEFSYQLPRLEYKPPKRKPAWFQ